MDAACCSWAIRGKWMPLLQLQELSLKFDHMMKAEVSGKFFDWCWLREIVGIETLSLNGIPKCSTANLTELLQLVGPHVRNLTVSCKPGSESFLISVGKYFSMVEQVTLQDCSKDPNAIMLFLNSISQSIKTLCFRRCKVTLPLQMAEIRFQVLKTLRLMDSLDADSAMLLLSSCTDLVEFGLAGFSYALDMLPIITEHHPNLQVLIVFNVASLAKHELCNAFRRLPHLRVVGLVATDDVIDDECIEVLVHSCKKLTGLFLATTGITSASMAAIGNHCNQLTHFAIDIGPQQTINTEGLLMLTCRCKGLVDLFIGGLRNDNGTDGIVSVLASCAASLQYLTLMNFDLEPGTLRTLSLNCKNLVHLSLHTQAPPLSWVGLEDIAVNARNLRLLSIRDLDEVSSSMYCRLWRRIQPGLTISKKFTFSPFWRELLQPLWPADEGME
jgi:hypothetical protein